MASGGGNPAPVSELSLKLHMKKQKKLINKSANFSYYLDLITEDIVSKFCVESKTVEETFVETADFAKAAVKIWSEIQNESDCLKELVKDKTVSPFAILLARVQTLAKLCPEDSYYGSNGKFDNIIHQLGTELVHLEELTQKLTPQLGNLILTLNDTVDVLRQKWELDLYEHEQRRIQIFEKSQRNIMKKSKVSKLNIFKRSKKNILKNSKEAILKNPKSNILELPMIEVVENPNNDGFEQPKEDIVEIPKNDILELPENDILEPEPLNGDDLENPNNEGLEEPKKDIVKIPKNDVLEIPKSDILEPELLKGDNLENPNNDGLAQPKNEVVEIPSNDVLEIPTSDILGSLMSNYFENQNNVSLKKSKNEVAEIPKNDVLELPKIDILEPPKSDNLEDQNNDSLEQLMNEVAEIPKNDVLELSKNDILEPPKSDNLENPNNDSLEQLKNEVAEIPKNDVLELAKNDILEPPMSDNLENPNNDSLEQNNDSNTENPKNDILEPMKFDIAENRNNEIFVLAQPKTHIIKKSKIFKINFFKRSKKNILKDSKKHILKNPKSEIVELPKIVIAENSKKDISEPLKDDHIPDIEIFKEPRNNIVDNPNKDNSILAEKLGVNLSDASPQADHLGPSFVELKKYVTNMRSTLSVVLENVLGIQQGFWEVDIPAIWSQKAQVKTIEEAVQYLVNESGKLGDSRVSRGLEMRYKAKLVAQISEMVYHGRQAYHSMKKLNNIIHQETLLLFEIWSHVKQNPDKKGDEGRATKN